MHCWIIYNHKKFYESGPSYKKSLSEYILEASDQLIYLFILLKNLFIIYKKVILEWRGRVWVVTDSTWKPKLTLTSTKKEKKFLREIGPMTLSITTLGIMTISLS